MKTSLLMICLFTSIIYLNYFNDEFKAGRIELTRDEIYQSQIPEVFLPSFLNTRKTITKLSSIADEISYITLSTPDNLVIGNIMSVKFCTPNIIFYDESLTVYLCSNQGSILSTINRTGRGPGEYTSIADIAFDTKSNQIVIACDSERKLIFNDIKGNFINEIKLPTRPEAIRYLDNSLILIKLSSYVGTGEEVLSSIVIDRTGKILRKHSYNVKEKPEQYVPLRHYGSITSSVDGLLIYEPFNDTIYQVNETGVRRPYIINNLGKYKAPRKAYESIGFSKKFGTQYFSNPTCYNINDYVLTSFRYKDISYNGLYDLTTKTAYLFEKGNDTFRLVDDIDLGPSFIRAKTVDKNIIVDILEPSKLVSDRSINPRKGSSLERIMSNLKEDDNPIIRIIRTKSNMVVS